VPVMRLKRVDLPTFGRPTSTTVEPSKGRDNNRAVYGTLQVAGDLTA
jgi:hypothetical protein